MDKSGNTSANTAVDARLWQQFRAGDKEAFAQLSRQHYRALYNYALKFSRDSDFISDCIQELYLELWERRSFLSETNFVKSYLFKALRNKIIKESIRLKRFQEPEELAFVSDAEFSVEARIVENEQQLHQARHLNHVISMLSKRQQEVVYLRFYQNLENEEIARIMSLTRPSVANLLYRTLKEMKENWIPSEFFWIFIFYFFS